MYRFHVHVPPEDYMALQEIAEQRGANATELYRRALKRLIEDHRAAREPAPAANSQTRED